MILTKTKAFFSHFGLTDWTKPLTPSHSSHPHTLLTPLTLTTHTPHTHNPPPHTLTLTTHPSHSTHSQPTPSHSTHSSHDSLVEHLAAVLVKEPQFAVESGDKHTMTIVGVAHTRHRLCGGWCGWGVNFQR